MAEKKTAATYEGIMRDLKARHYAPIYYLMGDEPYYIDKIADYVAENVLQPEERDFNQTVLFGSDTTAAQVADAAKRYPMMADHQVVIVKEAQALRSLEPLEFYLQHPLASTVLVMCHAGGTLDRRKKICGLIERAGVLFESKKLKEAQLPPFIESYLKAKGAGIDPKSTQIIADSVGADLNRLTAELDKLLIRLPDTDRRVTPKVVEECIGVSKDFNTFELRDAIVNRNVFKANQIVNYFDKNPKAGSPYQFIPLLFSYFQNLLLSYYCPQRNNAEALAAFLGLRSPWAAKDYLTGMRNYTGRKVFDIIGKLREMDAKCKGLDNPNTPSGELMKELIFFILH